MNRYFQVGTSCIYPVLYSWLFNYILTKEKRGQCGKDCPEIRLFYISKTVSSETIVKSHLSMVIAQLVIRFLHTGVPGISNHQGSSTHTSQSQRTHIRIAVFLVGKEVLSQNPKCFLMLWEKQRTCIYIGGEKHKENFKSAKFAHWKTFIIIIKNSPSSWKDHR